ncbi:MAG: hypothetical protein SVY10_19075 [Thermodesulfobacteriota bacterium]|nr:hypothetical protein [Thermodesulfobacteriota bacterium]
MIKEPSAMREIHQIMEEIYEKEKDLSKEELLARIKNESQQLIEDRGLKLDRIERGTPRLVIGNE